MPSMTAPQISSSGRYGRAELAIAALAGAVLIGIIGLRLWLAHGLPLWLDESWTGMIATQPGWTRFWREVWLDCNPPLYYALMALWTGLAGASDGALRLPSLIFMTGAALLPLIIQTPGLPRRAALGWAMLICLWWPGMELAVDARGYALLFLLSVAQAMAFVRMMAAPHLGPAILWAILASLAGLTHYHALLVGGLQGLALLWQHRARAVALWPAALAFVPAFGWLAWHAPRLADYARPDIAWYEPMTPALAGSFVRYALGGTSGLHAALLAGVLVVAALATRARVRQSPATAKLWPAPSAGLRWLVLASLAGLAIELILGSLRPMLTDRYLVPLVPGLLLGLILAAQRMSRPGVTMAALILVFGLQLQPTSLKQRLAMKTSYEFETASVALATQGISGLVFVWDHPASHILDHGSLAKLGGFFLHRAGQTVPVRPIILNPSDNGNLRLQQAAARQDGIIWIYNRARNSAARRHGPAPALWPGRACVHDHGAWVGTLACGPQRN